VSGTAHMWCVGCRCRCGRKATRKVNKVTAKCEEINVRDSRSVNFLSEPNVAQKV
jgi:hypothetical protein